MGIFTSVDPWVRCVLAASAMFGMFRAVVRRSRGALTPLPARSAALVVVLMAVVMAVPSYAGDLSKYRNFEFGSSLATVARQTGVEAEQARILQSRPASIQELDWRPQPLGSSAKAEAVKSVVFTFLNSELYRIVIEYDRYETEGLTADDMISAISATYGAALKPAAGMNTHPAQYADGEELIARWSNQQSGFELIRSSYGPSYKLIGVSNALDTREATPSAEAARLDAIEAPSREVARAASQDEQDRSRLEQTRAIN